MDQLFAGHGRKWDQSSGHGAGDGNLEDDRQRAIKAEREIIDIQLTMKISDMEKTIANDENDMLSKIQLYGTVPDDARLKFQMKSEELRKQIGDMKILQLRLKSALNDKNVTLDKFKANGYPNDLTKLTYYIDSRPKNNGHNGQINNSSQPSLSNGLAPGLNPSISSFEPSGVRRLGAFDFHQNQSDPLAQLRVPPKNEAPQIPQPKRQATPVDPEIANINADVLNELGGMSLDDFSPAEEKWEQVSSKKKPSSQAKAATFAELMKKPAIFQPARPGSANSSTSVETPKEQIQDPQKYLKTKLCDSFSKYGVCSYGDNCIFAHGEEQLRPFLQGATGPTYYKVKLCRNWTETGECRHGDRCVFAHGEEQLRRYTAASDSVTAGAHAEPCNNQQCPQKLMYLKRKTSICKFLGGSCTAVNCRYAHSKQELRPLPKYELCENNEHGYCQYSNDQCIYAHGALEKRVYKDFQGDESDCVICHEKITPHTHYKLACGHEQWHYGCIKQWVNDNEKSCPFCRQDVQVTEARERGKASLADFMT